MTTTQEVPALMDEVHRLHTHLHNLDEELARVPRLLKARDAQLAGLKQALDELAESTESMKRDQRKREAELRDLEANLAKWDQQLGEIGGAREYQVKQKEIARGRERAAAAEADILELMNRIEAAEQRHPEQELELIEAHDAADEFRDQMAKKRERLEREQTQARDELTAAEQKLPALTREKLAPLVAKLGAGAMAKAAGKSCGHCHMNMTTGQQSALRAGQFVACSGCGRALYAPPAA